jgi:hypothetical protein
LTRVRGWRLLQGLLIGVSPWVLAGCPLLLGIDESYSTGDAGAQGADATHTDARRADASRADAPRADAPRTDSAHADVGRGHGDGGSEEASLGPCSIAGTTYAAGATNPANACQICQPSVSTTAWQAATGACGAGEVCMGTTCAAGCYIDGATYAPGDVNPASACQVCTPGDATTAWSDTDGAPCGPTGAGATCNQGTCMCPPASPTMISGVVMDPGANVPLINVGVYIATAAPVRFVDEPANSTPGAPPACDTCEGLLTPGYEQGVATDVNGRFSLPATPGTYTVIAQIGRWRRVVEGVVVNECATTTIPNDAIRMPARQSEGDIPKMALVMGGNESLECWLAKVGISASEMAPYAPGATNRVQLYNTEPGGGDGGVAASGQSYWNGTSAVVPPSASALWDSLPELNTLNQYSAVLMACDSATLEKETAAGQTALVDYANAGGHLFLDHAAGPRWTDLATAATPTIPNSGWATAAIASWAPNAANPANEPVAGQALEGTPEQEAMHTWLSTWAGGPAMPGMFSASTARDAVTAVGPDSLELTSFPSLNAVGSFWFNTPITAAPGSYCGRVVVNDMHVPPARATLTAGGTTAATTFPGSCTITALSPEELIYEYELFAMSSCNIGATTPFAHRVRASR